MAEAEQEPQVFADGPITDDEKAAFRAVCPCAGVRLNEAKWRGRKTYAVCAAFADGRVQQVNTRPNRNGAFDVNDRARLLHNEALILKNWHIMVTTGCRPADVKLRDA